MPTLSRVRNWGLLAGPCLALLAAAALPPSYTGSDGEVVALGFAARSTAAATVWMGVWWMTEAIPLYATALLPLVLFPLAGSMTIRQAAAPYAHDLIFLFMGGFILALSMQRWGLDRRISLQALRIAGTTPAGIVAVFMGVTAVLSMWVSNTATSVMMLPIAVGVIELAEQAPQESGRSEGEGGSKFATCLLLGIAYAASIGGIGTLIGTPPNLFLASFVERELHIEIGFVQWMAVGLPLVALFLPVVWLLLTQVLFPAEVVEIESGAAQMEERRLALGGMRRGEWATLLVFCLAAGLWMGRPWIQSWEVGGTTPLAGLSDAGISIGAALLLFVIPVDWVSRVFTMDWETANRLPWGLLILFGGGLSLAAAISANGLGEYLAHNIRFLAGVPGPLIVMGIVTLMIFLTEITSNTATTATMVPILAGMAPALDVSPLLLVVPAAIAASCAFMLPVATPPNAVVFGTGRVRMVDMGRAGLLLNLIGVGLITALCYWLVPRLLGAL